MAARRHVFTGYQSAGEGANANWNDRRQAMVVTNVLHPSGGT